MGKRDARIDAYIAKQQDFAKPIIAYVREVMHEGCPDIEEDLKWNSPAFMYQGGILAGCAGFKQHVQFGFWKHDVVVGARVGMGFGKVTRIEDLPSRKQLLGHIRKAMKLQESGAKSPLMAKRKRKPIPMQADLEAALAKNKKAQAVFEDFSPSHQREYLEWITEAKGEDTRARRVKQAVEWMAQGKPRNWKYM